MWVGGECLPCGVGSVVERARCDALRCTQCDFRVVRFDGCAWAPDVDYLFLRNSVPDERKLAPKLLRKPGAAAYCCQCAWHTAGSSPEKVDLNSRMRWVCGGHR